MENINKLSNSELERLAKLSEELGEVQQAIGKIIRHGYNSFNPDDINHKGNRSDLERELEDVIKIVVLMQFNNDIRDIVNTDCWNFEDLRNKRYFHYQKNTK